MICASVDDQGSIDKISDFAEEVKLANPKIPTILVGTKIDMRRSNRDKCISSQRLYELGSQYNFTDTYETSSVNCSDSNVQTAFDKAIDLTTSHTCPDVL